MRQIRNSKKKKKGVYVTPIATKANNSEQPVSEEVVSGREFNEAAVSINEFQGILRRTIAEDRAKEKEEANKKESADRDDDKGAAIRIPDLLALFDKTSFLQTFSDKREESRSKILTLLAEGLAMQSAISDAVDMIRQGVSSKINVDSGDMQDLLFKALTTKYMEFVTEEIGVSEEGREEIRKHFIERAWAREAPKPQNNVTVEGVTVSVSDGKSQTKSSRKSSNTQPSERNTTSPIAVSSGRGPYGV